MLLLINCMNLFCLSKNCKQTYLGHDLYGRTALVGRDPMLDEIEHILVVQKADQMEGAKGSRRAKSQISDNHGTGSNINIVTYYVSQRRP